MDVELTRTALKGLGKMPTKERDALIEKIKAFAREDLLPPKILKSFLPTSGRIRHGLWRAVYFIGESNRTVAVLIIEAVGHRREIYE